MAFQILSKRPGARFGNVCQNGLDVTKFMHLVAYVIWVGCSFAFIALVPAEIAPQFLSVYATGSLMASLFSIPFYTSWRSRMFDVSFVLACLLAMVMTTQDWVFPLYWMSAFAMNITEFAVAQARKPNAALFFRVVIGLSAVLLLVDFFLAMQVRLALCSAAITWATFHKVYHGQNTSQFSYQKLVLSIVTCGLYFLPLIAIPHVAGTSAKIVYIAYAIAGNVILKLQDFIIKLRVTGASVSSRQDNNFYYPVCAASTLVLFFVLAFYSIWFTLFCIPIVVLIATVRIVDNVTWA